jgi:hypothetical protein
MQDKLHQLASWRRRDWKRLRPVPMRLPAKRGFSIDSLDAASVTGSTQRQGHAGPRRPQHQDMLRERKPCAEPCSGSYVTTTKKNLTPPTPPTKTPLPCRRRPYSPPWTLPYSQHTGLPSSPSGGPSLSRPCRPLRSRHDMTSFGDIRPVGYKQL